MPHKLLILCGWPACRTDCRSRRFRRLLAAWNHVPHSVLTFKVSTRAYVLNELRHSLSQIEILYCRDDRLTLGFCLGETHCICQDAIGNINRGFHSSILAKNGI
jgi:hypothetical protein